MADRRRKHVGWAVADSAGNLYSSVKDGAMLAVLMDIRDELQRLNELLHCRNFLDVPHTLRRIDRRLATSRKLTRRPR